MSWRARPRTGFVAPPRARATRPYATVRAGEAGGEKARRGGGAEARSKNATRESRARARARHRDAVAREKSGLAAVDAPSLQPRRDLARDRTSGMTWRSHACRRYVSYARSAKRSVFGRDYYTHARVFVSFSPPVDGKFPLKRQSSVDFCIANRRVSLPEILRKISYPEMMFYIRNSRVEDTLGVRYISWKKRASYKKLPSFKIPEMTFLIFVNLYSFALVLFIIVYRLSIIR